MIMEQEEALGERVHVKPPVAVRELFSTVVEGGFCIGCGACSAVEGSPIRMVLDEQGMYQPLLDTSVTEPALKTDPRLVCPFSNEAENEDELARALFDPDLAYSNELGYYRSTYAGYVAEGEYRQLGSSGGLGKWILCELLSRKHIDHVVEVCAVAPSGASPVLYEYRILESVDQVLQGSKSVYHPVHLGGVLTLIRENPGKYAITGVPCFIKALRLVARQDPVIAERLKFCIGLVCGHLKSTRYAEMIGWQMGVPPHELESIDFRKKLPGAKANEKGVEVRGQRTDPDSPPTDIVQNLFGTNYNFGFFQYPACDFCDDVVGETADISIGDAWLPEYISDGAGTNVVVVRDAVLQGLIDDAVAAGRLAMEPVDPQKIVDSQAGGFRQRREGLSYRLKLADSDKRWRPQKRVEARSNHISRRRKRVYRLRIRLSEESRTLYEQARTLDDFSLFKLGMKPLVEEYQNLYRPRFQFVRRILRSVNRRTTGIRKRLSLLKSH